MKERWQFDKFACIRDFFETVNEKNASMGSPSLCLAIDESIYLYREDIPKEINGLENREKGLFSMSSTVMKNFFLYRTLIRRSLAKGMLLS